MALKQVSPTRPIILFLVVAGDVLCQTSVILVADGANTPSLHPQFSHWSSVLLSKRLLSSSFPLVLDQEIHITFVIVHRCFSQLSVCLLIFMVTLATLKFRNFVKSDDPLFPLWLLH